MPNTELMVIRDDETDEKNHIEVVVTFSSAGETKPHLKIVDPTGSKTIVKLDAPLVIELEKLTTYLHEKHGMDPDRSALGRLLKKATVSCSAFYYAKSEPASDSGKQAGTPPDPNQKEPAKASEALLLVISLTVKGGVIGALTGDEHLGNLIDAESVSLRILRCSKQEKDGLVGYVKTLSPAAAS